MAFASGASATPSKPQQAQAAPQEHQGTGPERGTEQFPLIVEARSLPKTKAELAEENAERTAKTAADAKLVDLTGDLARYTGLLFVATALLAVGTGVLVVVGFLQVRDAKESIAAAVKAANAAEKAANAAFASHRPWVRVDFEIIGPLVFEEDVLRLPH